MKMDEDDPMAEIKKEMDKQKAEDEELDKIEAERQEKLKEVDLIIGDGSLFIVKSNVRKLIRSQDLKIFEGAFDILNTKVKNLILEACYRCKNNGRKKERRRAVRKHDF